MVRMVVMLRASSILNSTMERLIWWAGAAADQMLINIAAQKLAMRICVRRVAIYWVWKIGVASGAGKPPRTAPALISPKKGSKPAGRE